MLLAMRLCSKFVCTMCTTATWESGHPQAAFCCERLEGKQSISGLTLAPLYGVQVSLGRSTSGFVIVAQTGVYLSVHNQLQST